MNPDDLETRMNNVLVRLGLPYQVKWLPMEASNHGSINVNEKLITIHDTTEDQAWATLIHEVLELKLRPLLSYYRELVNTLITFIEKHVYNEKERFLEELPQFLTTVTKEVERTRHEQ